MAIETATLGGGCFWCLEAVYDQLNGVTDVLSGYAGGKRPSPTYAAVCTGTTGHAEVVQIKYDTDVITFRDLLDVFFTIHDPTTLNRQGADTGTQYRSVIYTHTPEQGADAQTAIASYNAGGIWNAPIVTEVTPYTAFYVAEDEHQEYFEKHPYAGYCRVVIAPKVSKFRQAFMARLRK
ncbi:MAG: peptide-methionine (S)-S-oxide reductase MsrA [Chloroflexota bacterium]|nr:peptide-methionine (S)-S-oxide reductase MsrA [Chloroflexota bacterium]